MGELNDDILACVHRAAFDRILRFRMLIYGAVAATALEAPSQQTWAGGFMSGAFGADVLRWIYLRYCNINVNMVTANSCFQLCASS